MIEALGLRNFVLIGMSMGGFNTMAYASRYPDHLKAVVIVDVSPTVRVEGARQIADFTRKQEFASFDEAVAYAAASNPQRPVAHLRYSLFHALKQRPDGRWECKHQRPRDPEQSPSDRDVMVKRRESLWDEVPKIRCPGLVVRGSMSNILSSEDAERLTRALPQGSLVTIEGASHTVQGDKPKELASALRQFFERLP